MANRNTKIGGPDYTEEGLKPSDQNDTNADIIDLAAVGVAQNAYQIYQSNGVFDNNDFLVNPVL